MSNSKTRIRVTNDLSGFEKFDGELNDYDHYSTTELFWELIYEQNTDHYILDNFIVIDHSTVEHDPFFVIGVTGKDGKIESYKFQGHYDSWQGDGYDFDDYDESHKVVSEQVTVQQWRRV